MNGIFGFLYQSWQTFLATVDDVRQAEALRLALKFIPFVLCFELPVQLTIVIGILKYYVRDRLSKIHPYVPPFHPRISALITGYGEGKDIQITIKSLTDQLYPGHIEILCVIDGALKNQHTFKAANEMISYVKHFPNRSLKIVPKLQRGGRVSSGNVALQLASGEVLLALDGDTSFDNDAAVHLVRHFADPNVVAVSGNLRVRNAHESLMTRLQALEYMLSIHAARTDLAEFNVINTISGAFGAYRRSFVQKIGGYDAGTAEDTDLTLRIKKYFARHPDLKIPFEPAAMGHTDAPTTFKVFLKQRLRWDGDLYYLLVRKHWRSITPRIFGWPNFILIVWTMLFMGVLLPLLIIPYTIYIFFVFPTPFVLGILAFVFLFYVLGTTFYFLLYLLLLSERPRYDLGFIWVLLLLPFLAFITRVWQGMSTLAEMSYNAHLDSSMAPWWVLRKTKY